MSQSQTGKHGMKRSEEARLRISEAHKGIPSSMKGKHFSEEVRKRMSAAQMGNTNGRGHKGKTWIIENDKRVWINA